MIVVRLREMRVNLLPKDSAPLVVRFELLPYINLPALSCFSGLSAGRCSFFFQKLWGGVNRKSSSASTYTPPPLLAQELCMREGGRSPSIDQSWRSGHWGRQTFGFIYTDHAHAVIIPAHEAVLRAPRVLASPCSSDQPHLGLAPLPCPGAPIQISPGPSVPI